MAQSQTEQYLYAVLGAIARLSVSTSSEYIADTLIAQELNLGVRDVRDYIDFLENNGKAKTFKVGAGWSAALTAKGHIALKNPEHRPTSIDSDKISAEIGEHASNVLVGKDIKQNITNNYTNSSALDGEALSDEEKELLIATAENEGEINLIHTEPVDFVRIRRNYIKDGEPSSAAPHREALEDLVERGYVRHERGVLYKLTSPGRRQARNLKPE